MKEIRLGVKHYNPDKSEKICDTPHGTLFRKRGRGNEFYLYNSGGSTAKEKITVVSWADANNLTKTYGSRDLWIKYFTTYGKETNPREGGSTAFSLDAYYKVKAQRNASIKGMNMTEYIKYLIDKDDANNNYAHKSGKFD